VIAVVIIPSRTLPRRADEADGHHSKGASLLAAALVAIPITPRYPNAISSGDWPGELDETPLAMSGQHSRGTS
jgi:hypothetical protein